jgi:hypothetical protein
MEENSTYESDNKNIDPWYMRAVLWLAGIFGSIYRATAMYAKNIPHRISNFYKQKLGERSRMPKRRSVNRVYVLIGYTTKEHIDKKFRKEKLMYYLRSMLIIAIIVILIILALNAVIPIIESTEYRQMLGIEDIAKMTEKDPFVSPTESNLVILSTAEATPTPESVDEMSALIVE